MRSAANMRLSVIIPAYNVEPYFRACLESVLAQGIDGLELVVADDGSDDGSRGIAEELAPAFRRRGGATILDLPHLGVSGARNAGLEASTGEYVLFMDSDDELIGSESLSAVLAAMDGGRYDLAHFDYRQSGGWREARPLSAGFEGSGPECFDRLYREGSYFPGIWLNCLRREVLARSGLRFAPGIVYEDMLFTPRLFHEAGRTAALAREVYHYKPRVGSITMGAYTSYRAECMGAILESLAADPPGNASSGYCDYCRFLLERAMRPARRGGMPVARPIRAARLVRKLPYAERRAGEALLRLSPALYVAAASLSGYARFAALEGAIASAWSAIASAWRKLGETRPLRFARKQGRRARRLMGRIARLIARLGASPD